MLDPITELILIKEKKNQSMLSEDFGIFSWLAAAGVAAYVAPKVTSFIRQTIKLKKKCGELKGDEKEDCVDSVKAGFDRNALGILRHARMQCPKTADPEKCNQEIGERIRMFSY